MYKLVIIDDKPNVIEGIQRFGDWATRGIEVVGAASNGLEALKLIETTRPDIAVTDIAMPLMNGLEFTAHAHKILPDLKIIVLSGYDQFEYAQQALRLGVVDYLLKPVKIDQIVAAVERAKNTLEAEKTTAGELEVLRRHTQKSEWQREVDGFLDQPDRWAALCETDATAAMNRLGLVEWLPEAARLVVFVPANLLVDIETAWQQTPFPERLLVAKERFGLTLAGEAEVNKLVDSWAEKHRSYQHLLLSQPASGPGELPHLYASLLDSLELVEFNRQELTGLVLKPDILKRPALDYPVAVEHEITRCLQVGLSEVIPGLVNKFYLAAGSGGLLDPTEARAFGLRLLTECGLLLSRQGNENQWLPIYGLPVAENRTRAELEAHLSDLICEQARLIAEQRQEKNKTAVERAIEFIHNNLQREISLDDVADELHFTPSYLANQFKKATGETVVEYIGRLKMEQAAELVCDPETKIASIAQALGYNDRRYFSELFRRKYGCTPSEYRERFWLAQRQA